MATALVTKNRATPSLAALNELGPVEQYDPRFLRCNTYVQNRTFVLIKQIAKESEKLLADPNIGREGFTTAMVAEAVGVSIGGIYRYFEDRIAIMDYVWPHRQDPTYSAPPVPDTPINDSP